MQALLTRAQDLGAISGRHAKTLWQKLSRAGYRGREHAELDVHTKVPSIMRELVNAHMTALGFSLQDLLTLLDCFEDELDAMYLAHTKRLRVVN